MALQTHTSTLEASIEGLVRKVREIETSADPKAPCPDAKAEAHEQARAVGIVLVESPVEDDMARRPRLHPMA